MSRTLSLHEKPLPSRFFNPPGLVRLGRVAALSPAITVLRS